MMLPLVIGLFCLAAETPPAVVTPPTVETAPAVETQSPDVASPVVEAPPAADAPGVADVPPTTVAPPTADIPGVDVYVTVDPPVFPYHKQTHFTVSVEHPVDVAVEIPELADQFGGLMVTSPAELKTEPLGKDRIRTSKTYTLEAIWAGDYPVKPVSIKAGEGQTITVPSPALRVRDLTEEETAAAEHFEPNAGPSGVRHDYLSDWRIWLAAGLIVAVPLCAGLVYYFARRKKVAAPPPASPWEIAYARLRDLDARQLPQQGDFQTYYIELSDILRHYIEERFNLHAPEETTPEFLAEASFAGALTETHQNLLGQFLRHCDRVKFARYEPTPKEMDMSLAVVLQFVDETVPVPAASPAKEEAA